MALKFKAGQRVIVRKSATQSAPQGRYRIVGAMPRAGGPVFYRVKNEIELFERVVDEEHLSEVQD